MKVIFHPEASEEKLESARFYEARSEGLGWDFLAAVEETPTASSNLPKPAQLTEQVFARGLYLAFRSRFFMKCSLIESSLRQ